MQHCATTEKKLASSPLARQVGFIPPLNNLHNPWFKRVGQQRSSALLCHWSGHLLSPAVKYPYGENIQVRNYTTRKDGGTHGLRRGELSLKPKQSTSSLQQHRRIDLPSRRSPGPASKDKMSLVWDSGSDSIRDSSRNSTLTQPQMGKMCKENDML